VIRSFGSKSRTNAVNLVKGCLAADESILWICKDPASSIAGARDVSLDLFDSAQPHVGDEQADRQQRNANVEDAASARRISGVTIAS
jgi:hypothetical protein